MIDDEIEDIEKEIVEETKNQIMEEENNIINSILDFLNEL